MKLKVNNYWGFIKAPTTTLFCLEVCNITLLELLFSHGGFEIVILNFGVSNGRSR